MLKQTNRKTNKQGKKKKIKKEKEKKPTANTYQIWVLLSFCILQREVK